MKRQAHFILLLGFLYLASNLLTVQAVQYIGPHDGVIEGQNWTISCNAPHTQIDWTRNGSFIPQLKRGEISVRSYADGISTIKSYEATEEHSGYYQCVPGPESFYLLIKRVQYIGPTDGLVEGRSWAISCNAPASQINWTRNGSFIPELPRGEIVIAPYRAGISTIIGSAYKEEHSGYYQCVPGPKSFYLLIKRGEGDSHKETQ